MVQKCTCAHTMHTQHVPTTATSSQSVLPDDSGGACNDGTGAAPDARPLLSERDLADGMLSEAALTAEAVAKHLIASGTIDANFSVRRFAESIAEHATMYIHSCTSDGFVFNVPPTTAPTARSVAAASAASPNQRPAHVAPRSAAPPTTSSRTLPTNVAQSVPAVVAAGDCTHAHDCEAKYTALQEQLRVLSLNMAELTVAVSAPGAASRARQGDTGQRSHPAPRPPPSAQQEPGLVAHQSAPAPMYGDDQRSTTTLESLHETILHHDHSLSHTRNPAVQLPFLGRNLAQAPRHQRPVHRPRAPLNVAQSRTSLPPRQLRHLTQS